jgi:hypothetical protein
MPVIAMQEERMLVALLPIAIDRAVGATVRSHGREDDWCSGSREGSIQVDAGRGEDLLLRVPGGVTVRVEMHGIAIPCDFFDAKN